MICTGAINFLWLYEPGFSNRLQVKYCARHNTQFPAELTHRERERKYKVVSTVKPIKSVVKLPSWSVSVLIF